MRISDWSSDVCSSDLGVGGGLRHCGGNRERRGAENHGKSCRASHRCAPTSVVGVALLLRRSTRWRADRSSFLFLQRPWPAPMAGPKKKAGPEVPRPAAAAAGAARRRLSPASADDLAGGEDEDRKSTRLNSSHECEY